MRESAGEHLSCKNTCHDENNVLWT